MSEQSQLSPLSRLYIKHWAHAADIPRDELDACYKLIRGIKAMYESSGMGWTPQAKKAEMNMSSLEYFILYELYDAKRSETDDSKTADSTAISMASIESYINKAVKSGNEINSQMEHTVKKRKMNRYANINSNFDTSGCKIIGFLSLEPIAPEFIDEDEDENDESDDDEDEEDVEGIADGKTKNGIDSNEESKPDILEIDRNSQVSYIYELHIAKTHQGLGLGKRLLDIAKERCLDEPTSKKLMLTVFNVNKSAQNFYLNNGFSYYKEPGVSDQGTNPNSNAVLDEKHDSKSLSHSRENGKQWHKDLKDFGKTRIKGYNQMEWIKR